MNSAFRREAAPFSVSIDRSQTAGTAAQAPSTIDDPCAPASDTSAHAELLRWLRLYFGVELG